MVPVGEMDPVSVWSIVICLVSEPVVVNVGVPGVLVAVPATDPERVAVPLWLRETVVLNVGVPGVLVAEAGEEPVGVVYKEDEGVTELDRDVVWELDPVCGCEAEELTVPDPVWACETEELTVPDPVWELESAWEPDEPIVLEIDWEPHREFVPELVWELDTV